MATNDAAAAWERITALASAPGACDLGQGWPDFGSNRTAVAAATRAMTAGDARAHQYAPVRGRAECVRALVEYYAKTGYDVRRPVDGGGVDDGSSCVVVTASATEALYGAFQGALRRTPGRDEIVFVEPFFPWYRAIADDLGGKSVVVRAEASDGFAIDVDAVRAACDARKTALLVMCSPHNPTGHCATRAELEGIAKIAEDLDLIVLSDEVYERAVFDDGGREHVRLATIGNMRERCVTLGSASKLLNVTGWRVGWAVGPKELIDPIKSAHSLMSYSAPTPLQIGVAAALDEISATATGRVEADENAAVMRANAQTLGKALEDVGMRVFYPQGGYFLTCDVSSTGLTDMEFCELLAARARVAAVPMSVFFLNAPDIPRSLVRFAICKIPETCAESARRIRAHAPYD